MPAFTWGEVVRIKTDAAVSLRPGAIAVVCAITEIESDSLAKAYAAPIGSEIYLIEFEDGTSIEIPGALIESAASHR